MPATVSVAGQTFEWWSRAEWGARKTNLASLGDNPPNRPRAYVHHTGGAPTKPGYRPQSTFSFDAEAAHMRNVQAYCIDAKGYTDIDYGCMVYGSGRILEGRGFNVRPAATLSENDESEAFCLAGDFEHYEPTNQQLAVLPLVIAWAATNHHLTRNPQVLGHYENPDHPNATSCPGRNIKKHLDALRIKVRDAINWTPPPVNVVVPALPGGPMAYRKRFVGYHNVFLVDGCIVNVSSETNDSLGAANPSPPLLTGPWHKQEARTYGLATGLWDEEADQPIVDGEHWVQSGEPI